MSKRADVLLHEKGLATSREKAKRLIMAGVVYIDEVKIDKPGEQIPINSNIIVREDPLKYSSRGGLKLEKAIREFKVDLENKKAVDIGASTGGFTDYMLQNGIEKVYAIDVGYGQLDYKLREDSRVVVMERTNIRYVEKDDIQDPIEIITIDVSFISLELVLPVAEKLIEDNGEIIALIKPQFEAGRSRVGKNGLVKDKSIHIDVLEKIIDFCSSINLKVTDLSFSPITGAKGNIEYLAKIEKNNETTKDKTVDIQAVVEDAHSKL